NHVVGNLQRVSLGHRDQYSCAPRLSCGSWVPTLPVHKFTGAQSMALFRKKAVMPTKDESLPGRSTPLKIPDRHFVNGHRITPPVPAGMHEAIFGMGCFWGAERLFWQTPGVYSTAVGYAGGYTPNATYEEVCSGLTGHTEVVKVIYDPEK